MEIQALSRKKLPIGIQTLREIREEGCYYVDKTPFALRLITQGKPYFLSRPRRFGKSLFVDTLKELFEGNQALFKGLYAETRWDWSIKYPVIRLSFGSGILQNRAQLDSAILAQLDFYEKSFDIPAADIDIPYRFKHLIRSLHQQVGQRVVVLVDEYDKPILDNLSQPELASEIRDGLRNLYSVLKDADAHLKFVFLTGVSKFSKVNLFSGLNHLNDITVDTEYSAICGYTDKDIDTVFAPELAELDRQLIRDWYNGYNWTGEAVYNPFDLLLLFDKRKFRPYWFETGTPTFLVNFLAQHRWFTPNLMRLQTSESFISRFDIEQISPEALLWQTGYLTFNKIEELRPGRWQYTMGYPNREVESALNEALLPAYGPDANQVDTARSSTEAALMANDLEQLRKSFYALFASIPHASVVNESASLTTEDSRADWYRKNTLAQSEGYYASVFYSQLAALGLDVCVEDATNKGRIDLALRYGKQVYLFEFKVIEQVPKGKALQQLIDKAYAEKYQTPGVTVTLIGVEFSREQRNIVGWETLLLAERLATRQIDDVLGVIPKDNLWDAFEKSVSKFSDDYMQDTSL